MTNAESYGATESRSEPAAVPLLVPAQTSRTLYAAALRLSFAIDSVYDSGVGEWLMNNAAEPPPGWRLAQSCPRPGALSSGWAAAAPGLASASLGSAGFHVALGVGWGAYQRLRFWWPLMVSYPPAGM